MNAVMTIPAISYLKTAVNGWSNLIKKDPEIEIIAKERSEICSQCTHKVLMTCGLCGCPLAAKQRAVDGKCPAGLWLR